MLQHPTELFLRRILAIERNRSGKLSRVHLFGSFANEREDNVPILGELAQFVNKDNEQELRRELLRNVQSFSRRSKVTIRLPSGNVPCRF